MTRRVHQTWWRARGVAGILALLLGWPMSSAGQATSTSELWREWDVLHREWQTESRALKADRARHKARREARNTPPNVDSAETQDDGTRPQK